MPEEPTNSIDGQPVSEYTYLVYQTWKEERFRASPKELKESLFLVAVSLFAFAGIFSLGALTAITYIERNFHCEVKAYGSTP